MAIEILLRMTRGAGDRLDGSATVADRSDVYHFSGMLELLRVFEDLVPPLGSGLGAGQRASEPSSASDPHT